MHSTVSVIVPASKHRSQSSSGSVIYREAMIGLHIIKELLIFLSLVIYHFWEGVFRRIIPRPLKDVSREIVLITGGAQGIGKELASVYGSLGAKVIIVDLNEEANEATKVQLKRDRVDAYAYICDVTKREDVLKLAKTVEQDVGPVTILINNAGVLFSGNIFNHTEQQIRKTYEVNVIANFWMLQAFLPGMIKRNHGHVVSMCSLSGLNGVGNISAYSSSKFALKGLMESVERELDNIDSKVKLTTVFPFFVNTGFCKARKLGLLPELSPRAVARITVKAQRRGITQVSVPGILQSLYNFSHIFPKQCSKDTMNFLGFGVEDNDNLSPNLDP